MASPIGLAAASAAVYIVVVCMPGSKDHSINQLLHEALWLLPFFLGLSAVRTPGEAIGVFCTVLAIYVSYKVGLIRSSAPELVAPLPVDCTTPEDVERWLANRDAAAGPLQDKANARIIWSGKHGAKSEIVVVFVHGWSASVREIDPVDARIASNLGATLLRYRLTGHGLKPTERGGQAMLHTATRDALLCDIAQAFACAKILGKRVILCGSSTGATLSVWLASQPWSAPHLQAMVVISPAFALRKPEPRVYLGLKWVIACAPKFVSTAIINAAVGREHFVTAPPECPDQAEYSIAWTRRYPSAAALHLIQLYVTLESVVHWEGLHTPLVAFANPKDVVVDFRVTENRVAAMPAAELQVVTETKATHAITGCLCSPGTVDRIVDDSMRFLRAHLGTGIDGGAASAAGGRRQRTVSPAPSSRSTSARPR